MKSYSVEAFVLRTRPLGEADRIVTLFSRERGKIEAVAKGARKTLSKYGARLDFFARSRVSLHAGRSLDVVTGVASISAMWERLVDPAVYSFASYVAEMIDGLSERDFPVPELFDMLGELQSLAAPATVGALAPAVDLRILGVLGFAPELEACARCGSVLGKRPFAGGRASLSPEAGGLVCRACLEGGSSDEGEMRREFGIVRISAAQFDLLRRARNATLQEAADLPGLERLSSATHAFVRQQMGRASRALAATASGDGVLATSGRRRG